MIITGVSFFFIFVTEVAYRDPIFENCVETIQNLQKSSPEFVVEFMNIFTNFGGGPLSALIMLGLMLELDQRWRVIYHSLMITIIVVMITTLKMIYEQDRPNWLDPSITVGTFDCTLEYGNPSGHAFEAATSSFIIYFDMLLSMGARSKKKYLWCYSLIWLPFPVCYSFAMGFSRVLTGVHAWNQVIFGWLLGIWLACFCSFFLRYPIRNHVIGLLRENQTPNYTRYGMLLMAFFVSNILVIGLVFMVKNSDKT